MSKHAPTRAPSRHKAVAKYRPECVCVTLRRASRALTRLYDDALAPCGIKITQFSLLRAIARLEPTPIGALADDQELERTTLARNLAPLERNGWITQAAGSDRRVSEIALTRAGRSAIARALPLWRRTQQRIRTLFDAEKLELLGEIAALR